jgi:hypothetical protein
VIVVGSFVSPIFAGIWGFVLAVAALLPVGIGYAIAIGPLLTGLTASPTRLSIEASYREYLPQYSRGALWLGLLGAVVFVGLGGVWWAKQPDRWPDALLTILFFGACGLAAGYMLYLKRWEGS